LESEQEKNAGKMHGAMHTLILRRLSSCLRLEFDYRLPLPVADSTPVFFIAIPKLSRVNNNEVVSMYNGMTVRDWLELAVGSRHMWVNLISLELQGALGEVLLAEL
jgi:hypothetical protein